MVLIAIIIIPERRIDGVFKKCMCSQFLYNVFIFSNVCIQPSLDIILNLNNMSV